MKNKRCYNCGDKEHVSADCPSNSEGPKCYKCKGHGLIAEKCNNLSESPKEICSAWRLLQTKCGKDVKIGDFELNALIDTDSELTLMRADQYLKIGAPKLDQKIVKFRCISENFR